MVWSTSPQSRNDAGAESAPLPSWMSSKERRPTGLNRPQRLQPRLGVDLVLADHHGLAAEAFDDGADVGAHHRAGQQHRALALQGGALEGFADRADEVLQPRWRQRQLLVVALA